MLATPVVSNPPHPGQLLSVHAVPGNRPGRVVVEVIGAVDTFTVPLLQLCLDSRTNQRDLRELVVDLERATFLGTAGVAALVRTHRRCRARGIALFLRRAGRRRLLGPLQLAELAHQVGADRVGKRRPQGEGGRTATRPQPAPREPRGERRPQT